MLKISRVLASPLRLLAVIFLGLSCVRAATVSQYHNDAQSTGVNAQETVLTPANVNINTFSKLHETTVDGQVYAQPLYVPNVNVTAGANAGTHNLVFIETQHDSLYAIDANSGAIVWQDSFLSNGINGATSITSVPYTDLNSNDVTPEIGVCSTPYIDVPNHLLYVTAKTKQTVGSDFHYVYTLYKIDFTLGNAVANANIVGSKVIGDTLCNNPASANATYTYRTDPDPTVAQDPFVANATGDGNISINGQSRVYFNTLRQMNRPGLIIANGVLYIAFGSHGDIGPYHGWVLGYDPSTLALVAVSNLTPNGGLGGLWSCGEAPAVDASGNLYVLTGNGTFEGTNNNGVAAGLDSNGFPNQGDFGDCFVKLAPDATTSVGNQNANGWGLKVADYFAPFNNQALSAGDTDLGAGGCVVLPDSAGSVDHPHILVGAGKEGKIYLLDRDNLGKFDPVADHVVQASAVLRASFDTPAYFNGKLYYCGVNNNAMSFDLANATLSAPTVGPDQFSFPGATPTISGNGTSDGVVWLLNRNPAELRAYSATDITTKLWTSKQAPNSRDAFGVPVKFATPTVADGQVFLGTSNALVIYGLTPPSLATVVTNAATGVVTTTATLSATVNPNGSDTQLYFEFGTTLAYGGTTSTQGAGSGHDSATFTQGIQGLTPLTTYHYRAVTISSAGTVYGNDRTFVTLAAPFFADPPRVVLSGTGAQVTAQIVPNGLATTYFIQYGPSSSDYSMTTIPVSAGRGRAPISINVQLTGLTPNSGYHFRVVLTGPNGSVYSQDHPIITLPITTTVVAQTGGAAAGIDGATFASFGEPAINNSGHTAFLANLNAGAGGVSRFNYVGLWADDSGGNRQLIARQGVGAAPGAGNATFAAFGNPAYNSSNAVAFIGTLNPLAGTISRFNQTGIWSNCSGALSLVARQGSIAPGAGNATFGIFSQLALPEGRGPTFLAVLNANAATGVTRYNNIGLWTTPASGPPVLVARTGSQLNSKTVAALTLLTPAANVSGQSRSVAPANGDMTFLATFTDRTTAVFSATPLSAPVLVAPQGGSAADVPNGSYAVFGNPIINGNGHIAFKSYLTLKAGVATATNRLGLWVDDGSGALHLEARTASDPAPGLSASFLNFSDPVYNDNDDFAFIGSVALTGGVTRYSNLGIWSSTSGSLALVAENGATSAPGCPDGTTFASFSQLVLPDQDGVIFQGTLNANATGGIAAGTPGIWATDASGHLQLIVRAGASLPTSVTNTIAGPIPSSFQTVSSFTFLPILAGVSGQSRSFGTSGGNLVYHAYFTNRTSAIVTVAY